MACQPSCNPPTTVNDPTKTCPGAGQYCCVAAGGTTTTAGGATSITFANPLAFRTVDELLTSLLTFLQSFIVILALIFIIIGALLYVTSAGNDGRMEAAKKCILGAMIGLALGIAAPAFLREIYKIVQGRDPLNLPPGVGTSLTLLQIATNVLNFLLTIIGILAIIMLVIGGMMYLLAAGDEDRIDRGKKIVKYSIIGIIIALGSMVLVRQLAAFFT